MNQQGKLFRYSASAGSGKTHALTGFYLSRVLHDPFAYRRILAVTFTNSAASEMKSRILARLNQLGSEPVNETESRERNEFLEGLCHDFPELFPDIEKTKATVRKNAPIALKNILQDYSRFTVGTIDSFFQRIIRAFAREIDMPAGYEIELEHDILLGNAVDELLYQVATDTRLRSWVTEYVKTRLDDNKNWDIRREIMDVSSRIFGEDFRQLSEDDRKKLGDYEILNIYTQKVFKEKNGFESDLRSLAGKGVTIFEATGLTVTDFSYKDNGGVGDWLKRYSKGQIKRPNSHWLKASEKSSFLPGNAGAETISALNEALKKGLGDVIRQIVTLFNARYSAYLSAVAQVRTIHVMGILGAISEKVRTLAHDENLFILSDSGELINKLIADDDAPFIYEKIGTVYDHYIIDEFQDTSQIQWNNFKPLIKETLSRGKDNLVVGDVKQSIYRWRNSDWRILHSEIESDFSKDIVRTIPLKVNYRSRENIIRFNNTLFKPDSSPSMCDTKLDAPELSLRSVYSGAEQESAGNKKGGLVSVTLYSRDDEEKWKERVLKDLPAMIEQLQDNGYRANDILLLSRTNEEGKSIINRILEYSSADNVNKKKYNFEVTSGDSLYLERNPAVTLILSCLRYMIDPQNRINLSLMARSFALASGKDDSSIYIADRTDELPENMLPEGWKEHLDELRNSSLFAASEKMIDLFCLGEGHENVAFISSFQDIILWYSARYSSDTASFLSWWEEEGYRKTVAQSEHQEAMRVMTIHKAKGLQSKVVIVPFVSWEFKSHGFSKPLLWVTDVPEAFSPIPVVLPEMSSQLEESLFSGQAKMERASLWLDGLNMLYVAFTRAVDALFIMGPENKHPGSVSDNTESIICNVLHDGLDDFKWKEDGGKRMLLIGKLLPVDFKDEKALIQMSRYNVSERRGSLRLKTGGALPLDDLRIDEPGGRAYGVMMHELLSRIITVDDIDTAVSYVCEKGLVQSTQRSLLIKKVNEMLSSQKVKEWFDGSSAVRNEATIILPSGVARRPDRVMLKDDSITVLDFKFGEASPRHLHQAHGYRELLEKMGYKNVRAWLWYVEKDMIEEA